MFTTGGTDTDGRPTSCFVYPMKDSNRLVEEFMLLANQLVAVKIKTAFPDRALLRRHPEPEARGLAALVLRAHELGVELDVATSKAFQVGGPGGPLARADRPLLTVAHVGVCPRPLPAFRRPWNGSRIQASGR